MIGSPRSTLRDCDAGETSGSRRFRIACTGFVSDQAGSVASANGLLLQGLIGEGVEIDFFSKPSFVDPRPSVGERDGFRFVPAINSWPDRFRRKLERIPLAGALAARNDAATYNRLLVRRIRGEHLLRSYDIVLWMGDYAHGSVPNVATVSFAQGAPGTDARSILARKQEIRRLAGWREALKWEVLARLRLSRMGLPKLKWSDHFIVGSSVSRNRLVETYRIPRERISTLPYPIDLGLFRPPHGQRDQGAGKTLRVLWLGRIVPRKRLDLFLKGAEIAIRAGVNLRVTLAGGIGFIRGYEEMIENFPFRERLERIFALPRSDVPALLRRHDVLVQPSQEENFGSSVAEAQACGLPVIVGATNGNADYLCERDIHLKDYLPETLASAFRELARRMDANQWGNDADSSRVAETHFDLKNILPRLLNILEGVRQRHRAGRSARAEFQL